MKLKPLLSIGTIGVAMVAVYLAGYKDGKHGEEPQMIAQVHAARGSSTATGAGWSPTKPYPVQEVYYPGTEELRAEEMRVLACGSGMPMPRLKQAAACFLIELGNGEKFIFDLGRVRSPPCTHWACRWII